MTSAPIGRGVRWHVARSALVGALLFGLLPFGATGPFAMPLASLAVCVAGVLACALPSAEPGRRWLERSALALALGLALYIIAQSTAWGSWLPPHPVWASASDLLQTPLRGVASVAPSASLAAIPAIVAPFLLFVAGLRVASDDAAAIGLLRIAALVAGCLAVLGLLQFVLSPASLLLTEKLAYRDSLTLVFVNRNTAATYLGSAILVLLALLQVEAGRRGVRATLAALLDPDVRVPRGKRIVAYLLMTAVCVVAILLTRSRAGIACGALALAFYALATAALSPSRKRASLAAAASAIAATIAALLVFGGRVMLRAQQGIADDARFCVLPGIWRAARDGWPFGTGAGTFELVFRAYRDPACGLYGSWRHAHNFYLEGSIALGAAFWIALLVALTLLTVVLAEGARARNRLRAVPVAGLAVVLLLVLHDLVDFSVQIPGLAFHAAFVLAACCSIALRKRTAVPRADRAAVRPATA